MVDVCRNPRIWEEDIGVAQYCIHRISSVLYSWSDSADEKIRRSKNSVRDLRNFLNMGSLDVIGYTTQLSSYPQ